MFVDVCFPERCIIPAVDASGITGSQQVTECESSSAIIYT